MLFMLFIQLNVFKRARIVVWCISVSESFENKLHHISRNMLQFPFWVYYMAHLNQFKSLVKKNWFHCVVASWYVVLYLFSNGGNKIKYEYCVTLLLYCCYFVVWGCYSLWWKSFSWSYWNLAYVKSQMKDFYWLQL